EDGIRDFHVTGVQTCALPILGPAPEPRILRRRPLWRLRPDHPLELPAADAGLEDRPGPCRRQYGRAQACRIHLADGLVVRRNLRSEERRVGKECRCGGWAETR